MWWSWESTAWGSRDRNWSFMKRQKRSMLAADLNGSVPAIEGEEGRGRTAKEGPALPHVPHQRGLSGSRNVCRARLGTPWHRGRGSSRADVLRAAGLQRRISSGRENGGAPHDLRASAHGGPYRDPVRLLRGHGGSPIRSPLSRRRGVAGESAWRRAALPRG